MSHELICIYISLKNKLSIQKLNNVKASAEDMYDFKHIQGWSNTKSSPITLLTSRIIKTYDTVENAQADFPLQSSILEKNGIILTTDSNSPPKAAGISPSSDNTFDVCFTGFSSQDKSELTNLAERNNMIIRKSVVKKLDILCCGYNAGPKKLESALIQGVTVLNKAQFEHFIETGEITEN